MNKKRIQLLMILILLATLVISPPMLSADGPPGKLGDEYLAPVGYGDDGRWEVGVEYVNYYPWPTRDVWRTDNTARSLYNQLRWAGWTRRFMYGNRWAWEEDWKVSWRGGTEYRYVDSVDLALFAGHGGRGWDSYYRRSLRGPVFGNGGRSHDDPYLTPGDARRAWGNKDLEWVALHGCSILDNSSRRYWAASMYGLHLLMGYRTTAYDVNQGRPFGRRIRWRWRIPQAWFAATDVSQPHRGVVARVLANELCHYYYDRWRSVCSDSYDWDYWYADHHAGSEQALMVNPTELNYEMPVFSVVAAAPSEDDLNQLSSAFGISPATPAVLDDESQMYRVTDGALDLTVDPQGMYYFIDLDNLWSQPTDTVRLEHQPLSPSDAGEIAEQFLLANDLMPTDAVFYEVVSDTLSAASIEEVPSTHINSLGVTETYTDVQETISQTVATAQQVIYSRHLVYTPTAQSPITFSVQGPGARLKVYLDNTGEVIGAMGGWRTIDNVGVLGTVEILTPTQVISLYSQVGDVLNLAPTPFLADAVTVTRSTVGYYEQPLGVDQSSLTPVYVLDTEMTDTSSGDSITSTAFIPAAANLLPPLAAITSVTEEQPQISNGETITLTAADASQPLSDLGYGDNLNIILGQGPYTYTWKLETTGTVIGTGRSITYEAGILDDLGVDKNNDVPMVVVLEVTDSAGNTSSAAQPFYFIGSTPMVQRIHLPVALRE